MSELKPCPFCGSNEIDEDFALQNNGNKGVGCMNCGASTECKPTKEEAIKVWNTRHEPKVVAEFEGKPKYNGSYNRNMVYSDDYILISRKRGSFDDSKTRKVIIQEVEDE